MKLSEYKSYDDLPLFLNTAMVAKVLGVSPSSGYELMHVVGTSSASLASGQGRKLVRSTVPPLPTKPKDGFAGSLVFRAQSWQPDGSAEGKVRGVGSAAHVRRWRRLKERQKWHNGENSFFLPSEVFDLCLCSATRFLRISDKINEKN